MIIATDQTWSFLAGKAKSPDTAMPLSQLSSPMHCCDNKISRPESVSQVVQLSASEVCRKRCTPKQRDEALDSHCISRLWRQHLPMPPRLKAALAGQVVECSSI